MLGGVEAILKKGSQNGSLYFSFGALVIKQLILRALKIFCFKVVEALNI